MKFTAAWGDYDNPNIDIGRVAVYGFKGRVGMRTVNDSEPC